MALLKLQFQPGINRDRSNFSNEGGWWDGDKIRFRQGYPEKIGGWVSYAGNNYRGACRQMWNWYTSYNDDLLALGTHSKLYIEAGATFYDITPLRTTDPSFTTTITDNCINTSSGSNVVTVDFGSPNAHSLSDGDFVTISGVTGTVGGIPDEEINADHEVTVVDNFSFTITVSTNASSTVAGGGGTAITVEFPIATGFPLTTAGYGWNTDSWGSGSWGSSSNSPVFQAQQDWWLDNFDNDLIANVRQGEGYLWARGTVTSPASALETRAVRLVDQATTDGFDPNAVPIKIGQLLVSQQDKHLIAFGAVPFGSTDPATYDPLLIRWADQDTPTQWTPEATNSAGFLRVSRGSRIIRALPTRQEILVFTDNTLHSLQFLGNNFVFGLQEYASNVSLIGPRAVIEAAGVVYWMGNRRFYSYDGRVNVVPSTLEDYIFRDFNYSQSDSVIAGTNEEWNEIWWFYPSETSDWNDRYVIFNYVEGVWAFGSMARTAWLDPVTRRFPLATESTYDGTTVSNEAIYQHEDGLDANGQPMNAFIESSDFDLGEGDQFMLTTSLIPDLRFRDSAINDPSVDFTFKTRRHPGGALGNDTTDSQTVTRTGVDQFTEKVFIRARGRQGAIRVESNSVGVQWRLGTPRLDVRPDGRR